MRAYYFPFLPSHFLCSVFVFCFFFCFFVVSHATYKDKNRLYFLLDPVLGGELFSLLREKTLFDEDTARFYAASVILGFEYMHDLNFVYRDLKPENLLVAQDGYLKITGNKTTINNQRTNKDKYK